eukprot:2119873-Amphidinium_carterae.2
MQSSQAIYFLRKFQKQRASNPMHVNNHLPEKTKKVVALLQANTKLASRLCCNPTPQLHCHSIAHRNFESTLM